MDYYLDKEWNLAISDNIDGPRGYYEKWNKSDRERQCDFIDMWNLKNSTNVQTWLNRNSVLNTENK